MSKLYYKTARMPKEKKKPKQWGKSKTVQGRGYTIAELAQRAKNGILPQSTPVQYNDADIDEINSFFGVGNYDFADADRAIKAAQAMASVASDAAAHALEEKRKKDEQKAWEENYQKQLAEQHKDQPKSE